MKRVDRRSARWLRLRAACQHAASGIDLDQHTDFIYRTLEARTNTTGTGRTSHSGISAAGARRSSS